MRIAIYYSSITGNTKRLALFIAGKLKEHGCDVVCEAVGADAAPIDADLYILAFWCRRSSFDDNSRALLDSLHGKRVLALGTLGADAAGAYGRKVEQKVEDCIKQENICVGVLSCQGSVNIQKLEQRRKLPPDDPHYVTEERYQQRLANQGKPLAADMEAAWEYVRRVLQKEQE